MSYLGNSPPSQNFVAGADQFSGTGSQTAFTLSRNVNTVFDIFVTVSNVPQDPFTAYTVAGNTLTFDGAPPSGTNNIDVVYRATNVQTFVPSPGVSQQFAIGTAASPAITFIGDTNTGIFSPAADTIAFTEGGIERMRLDSAGNVGIGTSSPGGRLHVAGSGSVTQFISSSNGGTIRLGFDSTGAIYNWIESDSTVGMRFAVANAEQARITAAGLFQFNSGYGSVATAYGCRAWVNFNGTGTVAIRASGNVTSITDNGTGDYTVNFTTAMPDANYAVVPFAGTIGSTNIFVPTLSSAASPQIAASVRIVTRSGASAATDLDMIQVAIFR